MLDSQKGIAQGESSYPLKPQKNDSELEDDMNQNFFVSSLVR